MPSCGRVFPAGDSCYQSGGSLASARICNQTYGESSVGAPAGVGRGDGLVLLGVEQRPVSLGLLPPPAPLGQQREREGNADCEEGCDCAREGLKDEGYLPR